MPIKRVQFPDGSIRRVEVPEGATDEQILEFVASQQPAEQRGRPNRAARGPEAATPMQPKAPAANNSDFARMVTGKPRQPEMGFAQGARIAMQAKGNTPAVAALDFVDAAQHHVGSAVIGAGQLLNQGRAALGRAVGLPSPMLEAGNRVGPEVLTRRESDYQARVPDSLPAYAGAAVGEVLPWMTGMAELRAAGVLPQIAATGVKGALQKGGLLALEGGAMGAVQPVTEDGSYGAQKAAQVGVGAVAAPLIGGGVKAAGALARTARYATPGGREAIANERLAKLYGSDAEVIARMRAGSGVDGVELTPGQALATPEAVQAERVLRNNSATAPAFAARESANNAALRGQVANVAGDDAALDAARQARSQNADAFRSQFLPETGSPLVDAAPLFSTLERLSLSANPAIRGAAREHLSLLRRQAVDGKVPAYALDDVRQNAGKMIAKHTPQGGGGSKEAAQYGAVTNQIADTLDRAIPGYRDYLAAYARDSQPINDMEAGRALLAAIDSGGRDAGGNQAVNLNAVKAMLARDNRANFPMSESARSQIEAVMEVLQRRSVTNNNIAASGPGTAADLQRAIQGSPLLMRLLGQSAGFGVGSLFGSPGVGYAAGVGAGELATAASNDVTRRMAQTAASAPRAADALEAVRMRQQRPSVLDLLLPYDQRALPPPR